MSEVHTLKSVGERMHYCEKLVCNELSDGVRYGDV